MSAKIYVIGNKVDIPDERLVSTHECLDCIVFIGKMDYDPNVVAVVYFAERILPVLLELHPHLKFIIVGAHPSARVQALANGENVIVTGYVDSIEPYYQKATIVVVPMLTGAGIQNKIIQAMAYGCCVVTTSTGAEGLDIQHNEIAIVDGEGHIANTILRLLDDVGERRSMGRMAREYVIKKLSFQVVSEQFWKFVNNK